MAVVDDIARSYRSPGTVVRRLVTGDVREDRALAMLIGAAALIFVASLPAARRAAFLDPAVPFEGAMAARLFALLFLLPLAAYGLAAVSHLILRALGGGGSFYAARVALFWALLAVTPLMLLQGLMAGLLGQGGPAAAAGIAVFGAFLWVWAGGLRASHFGAPA